MKKDWLIYAAITGGVIAVVYIRQENASRRASPAESGAVGSIHGVVQTLGNAAGTGNRFWISLRRDLVVGVVSGRRLR
jgi:hypothetical protein